MNTYIIKFKETSREEELEFYSNKLLIDKRHTFNTIDEAKNFPLVQQIFYLPFVKKVVLNKKSVYIEKLNILKWEEVQDELCKQLSEFLNNGGKVSNIENKTKTPITVYAESTPNPNVMKFVLNKQLFKEVHEFKNVDDTKNAPIAYTTIVHEINNKKKFKLKMDSIENSPKVANAIKQITSDITIE